MKAMQAAEELCFEPIDRLPDVDQVLAQGVCREIVNGPVDECIDGVMDAVSRLRDREGFH